MLSIKYESFGKLFHAPAETADRRGIGPYLGQVIGHCVLTGRNLLIVAYTSCINKIKPSLNHDTKVQSMQAHFLVTNHCMGKRITVRFKQLDFSLVQMLRPQTVQHQLHSHSVSSSKVLDTVIHTYLEHSNVCRIAVALRPMPSTLLSKCPLNWKFTILHY